MARGGLTVRTPGRQRMLKLGLLLENVDNMQMVIAKAQAEEAVDLIKVGFRKESDPYGDRWAKRKRRTRRTRGKKVLSDTGRMKSSTKVARVTRVGWRVSVSVNYAEPHQNPKRGAGGKLKRPRRMIVPSERIGMSRQWQKALGVVTSDAIRSYIAGQRR